MNREELQNTLPELFPGTALADGGEWLHLEIEPAAFRAAVEKLRNHDSLLFDYLFCLTCVDWKTHLTMVYHMSSTKHNHTLVVKVKLDREKPEIDTVCDLWRTAEFHEREVYELFGVIFLNHPDLRKLILPDDWVGFPLRKDYEDPVNMIRL
jgi:NADH-quinone oxidoreductase subunit C